MKRLCLVFGLLFIGCGDGNYYYISDDDSCIKYHEGNDKKYYTVEYLLDRECE